MTNRAPVQRSLRITATYVIVLGSLLPLLWLLSTALKTRKDAFASPPTLFFIPTFENFTKVMAQGDFLAAYGNSIVVVLATTLFSLVFGVTGGYTIARTSGKATKAMGMWIIMVRMAPAMGFALPFFLMFRALGMLDTYPALILVYMTITLPFVTWIMAGYFRSIPVELEEAARMDGCTRVEALFKVVVPSSWPGIVTCAIFSFIMSWNEFFYPLILSGRNTRTAPVAIQGYISSSGVNWGELAAASVLVILPVLIFTIFTQKGLVRGLTAGAIK